MKITVFTPTYNREPSLRRLYRSLQQQTNCDFEWVIVDDGSTDDTELLIDEFLQKNNRFSISYYKKANGGKYTAYNEGVKAAKGEMFLCVDSDDYLEKNAIKNIITLEEKIAQEPHIGIIALKKDIQGKILSSMLPSDITKCKIIDLSRKYKCNGEFSFIFKTEIVKQYLYPIVETEKFMGENIIYDKIDQEGEMYLYDKVITVCEYCQDGYTNNFLTVVLNNPTGYKLYYGQRIDLAITLKEKINYILRYHAFKRMSRDDRFDYEGNNEIWVKLMMPLGYLAYLLYERKKRKL